MEYVIYLLKCGKARYVGSSNNFKRRYYQHKKKLKEGTHVNDLLLSEYKRGNKLKYKILVRFHTMFRKQVLLKEQRYIRRYSNCNESKASKTIKYSKEELAMDILDFIKNNYKILLVFLFLILILVYNLSADQASEFIYKILDLYKGL